MQVESCYSEEPSHDSQRGWRRSGSYIYKPDMQRTCCPQYTIRLDATTFKATKSQRQVANRFAAFIRGGSPVSTVEPTPTQGVISKQKHKGKGKASIPFAIDAIFQECTSTCHTQAHRLEISLEAATFSEEKYDLYKLYQLKVHGDKESKLSPKSFARFLCDGPLELEDSGATQQYGQFHQLYRIDGQLVAFAVLDILSKCVSSVYFVWHPEWHANSLGKLSALREIALVRELRASGLTQMRYYYMGAYVSFDCFLPLLDTECQIHSCQKMRYKSEYIPSFLLDPQSNQFYPFEICKPLLDQDEHSSFSNPPTLFTLSQSNLSHIPHEFDTVSKNGENSTESGSSSEYAEEGNLPSSPLPLGFQSILSFTIEGMLQINVLERNRLVQLPLSRMWKGQDEDRKRQATEICQALGEELSKEIALYIP